MNWLVPLVDLDYGLEEEEGVLNVLRSRWLTMGAVTQEFEDSFAEYTNVKHTIAVSNATQALHLACLALGIGPGDEVIVPSLSFVATANVVLYTGADVRFAEINSPDDLNVSPASIEQQITPRTKAIIVVHYAGFPCQIASIIEIANRNGLAVIEDAAHAPGASVDEKSLGTWGDIGCFSFFSNKNLATGEGGMLVTDRDDLAARVETLRSHGMTSLTWDRHLGHAYSYDVTALGYNYRIDEIRSALGLVQLRKLSENNFRRGQISKAYWTGLKDVGVGLPFRDGVGHPAYHIFPTLLPEGLDRRKFIDKMRDNGIQTSIHYPPIHKFSYYQQKYPGLELPLTEGVAARELTLPLYPTMRNEDVNFVIETVRSLIKDCANQQTIYV